MQIRVENTGYLLLQNENGTRILMMRIFLRPQYLFMVELFLVET